MAINSLCQLRCHPGERQSKRHLDGETISRSIEVEKCEPVDGLARPQGREDYTQADDPEGQTVEWSEFDRGLLLAIVPHWGHPGPPENTSLTERSIVLQPSPVWNLLIAARIKKANRYPDWPFSSFENVATLLRYGSRRVPACLLSFRRRRIPWLAFNPALILHDENEYDSYEYSDATKHAHLGEMVFGRSNSR